MEHSANTSSTGFGRDFTYVGFNGQSGKAVSTPQNMLSAIQHPVDKYIAEEVAGRVAEVESSTPGFSHCCLSTG